MNYRAFAFIFGALAGIEGGLGRWWRSAGLVIFMLLAEGMSHRHHECRCQDANQAK